ncbi:MAG: LLM class flavin-dependent oxidoreductase [Candidatus Tectomicrobia bacterium]|uniref:LLM class flavin-dependent oxidoreductase n=1 Tax=Tectimicrobiota bacterium TaxID=2528274 RepID=A0A937W8W4_UNCTE|nr:LLM class flavin-dependent oxidoreductase [Candidatus Tectomicrobia bacterium]
MDLGLMMDCDYRVGQTQRAAFDNALAMADLAETLGFNGIWLAERHFSPPGGAALVPSIAASPLLMATACDTHKPHPHWHGSPACAVGASSTPGRRSRDSRQSRARPP